MNRQIVRLKYYMLFLMIFVAVSVYSQSVVYSVSGNVTDETEIPIENVSVYENGTLLRGVTDSNGYFAFTTERQEIILSFSHISYELEAVQFHLENLEKTTEGIYFVRVSLQKKNVLLPEVSVKANIPVLAYENKDVWVADYVVNQTGIILLSNRLKENVLLHLDWNQDTIAKRRIAKKFEYFYVDAFNHIHLVSKDSAYQLYCDNEKIHLLYGTTSSDFHTMLPPVAMATDSVLVLKFYQTGNQELFYLLINRNTSNVSMLANLGNEQKKEMMLHWARDDKRYADAMTAMYGNFDAVGAGIKGGYQYRIFSKSIYNPIFCLSDEIWLFAFENNQLLRYDKTGEEIETIPMTFHRVSNQKSVLNPNWVQEIVIDKAENRCYAQFIVNGIITLREIDLKSGNLMREIYVNHPFPEKIQIYNNYVYYVYADRSLSFPDKKSLYRMRIND